MLPLLAYALLFLAYYLNRVLRAVRQDLQDIKDHS